MADNWAVCPRCWIEHTKARAEREKELRAAYGKVSAEEYIAMRKDVEKEGEAGIEDTFREEYGIGVIYNGSFHLRYTGKCSTCNLEYKFSYNLDQIPGIKTKPKARGKTK